MHFTLAAFAFAFTLVAAQSGTDQCGAAVPVSSAPAAPVASAPVSSAIPSTSPVVASPTSSAQAPAQTSALFSESGQATFYTPGLGACGITNTVNDMIVAVSAQFFDTFPGATANPNNNPVCNKQLTANFQGKSVTVTVTDRCVGCAFGDIDLSPAAFDQLSDPAAGRLDGVTWTLS